MQSPHAAGGGIAGGNEGLDLDAGWACYQACEGGVREAWGLMGWPSCEDIVEDYFDVIGKGGELAGKARAATGETDSRMDVLVTPDERDATSASTAAGHEDGPAARLTHREFRRLARICWLREYDTDVVGVYTRLVALSESPAAATDTQHPTTTTPTPSTDAARAAADDGHSGGQGDAHPAPPHDDGSEEAADPGCGDDATGAVVPAQARGGAAGAGGAADGRAATAPLVENIWLRGVDPERLKDASRFFGLNIPEGDVEEALRAARGASRLSFVRFVMLLLRDPDRLRRHNARARLAAYRRRNHERSILCATGHARWARYRRPHAQEFLPLPLPPGLPAPPSYDSRNPLAPEAAVVTSTFSARRRAPGVGAGAAWDGVAGRTIHDNTTAAILDTTSTAGGGGCGSTIDHELVFAHADTLSGKKIPAHIFRRGDVVVWPAPDPPGGNDAVASQRDPKGNPTPPTDPPAPTDDTPATRALAGGDAVCAKPPSATAASEGGGSGAGGDEDEDDKKGAGTSENGVKEEEEEEMGANGDPRAGAVATTTVPPPASHPPLLIHRKSYVHETYTMREERCKQLGVAPPDPHRLGARPHYSGLRSRQCLSALVDPTAPLAGGEGGSRAVAAAPAATASPQRGGTPYASPYYISHHHRKRLARLKNKQGKLPKAKLSKYQQQQQHYFREMMRERRAEQEDVFARTTTTTAARHRPSPPANATAATATMGNANVGDNKNNKNNATTSTTAAGTTASILTSPPPGMCVGMVLDVDVATQRVKVHVLGEGTQECRPPATGDQAARVRGGIDDGKEARVLRSSSRSSSSAASGRGQPGAEQHAEAAALAGALAATVMAAVDAAEVGARVRAVADGLYEAMSGLGTDEGAIYTHVTRVHTAAQWAAVRDAFAGAYAGFHEGDVAAALRDELSEGELQKVVEILKGAGVTGVLPTTPSPDGGPDAATTSGDGADGAGGDEQKEEQTAPADREPPPQRPPVDTAKAQKVADALYKAMKGLGTDEDAIYTAVARVASQREWNAVCAAFAREYEGFNDGNLVVSLKDELSDEELQRVRDALAEAEARLEPTTDDGDGDGDDGGAADTLDAAAIADTVYTATKGLGTDEDAIYTAITRIATPKDWRAVCDAFARAYAEFHGGDMAAALRDELSGEEVGRVAAILERASVDFGAAGGGGAPGGRQEDAGSGGASRSESRESEASKGRGGGGGGDGEASEDPKTNDEPPAEGHSSTPSQTPDTAQPDPPASSSTPGAGERAATATAGSHSTTEHEDAGTEGRVGGGVEDAHAAAPPASYDLWLPANLLCHAPDGGGGGGGGTLIHAGSTGTGGGLGPKTSEELCVLALENLGVPVVPRHHPGGPPPTVPVQPVAAGVGGVYSSTLPHPPPRARPRSPRTLPPGSARGSRAGRHAAGGRGAPRGTTTTTNAMVTVGGARAGGDVGVKRPATAPQPAEGLAGGETGGSSGSTALAPMLPPAPPRGGRAKPPASASPYGPPRPTPPHAPAAAGTGAAGAGALAKAPASAGGSRSGAPRNATGAIGVPTVRYRKLMHEVLSLKQALTMEVLRVRERDAVIADLRRKDARGGHPQQQQAAEEHVQQQPPADTASVHHPHPDAEPEQPAAVIGAGS